MSRTRARRAGLVTALLGLVSTLLAAGLVSPAQATFAGSTGRVVFVRTGNLWTATAGHRDVRQLTTVGGINGPSWSPDGTRIAYRRNRQLVVLDVATGRTEIVAVGADTAPRWSPDGAQLAYIAEVPSAVCGEQAVFTVPADGRAAPHLVFDPQSDNCPHGADRLGLGDWMPGGVRIMLTLCNSWYSASCGIYKVSTDPWVPAATELLTITCSQASDTAGLCGFRLHLSDVRVAPDGGTLVFSGKGGYDGPTGTLPGSTAMATTGTPGHLYAMDADGNGLRQLTSATGLSAVFSPTGENVLFAQRQPATGTSAVLAAPATATADAPAEPWLENASQPDWQPVP